MIDPFVRDCDEPTLLRLGAELRVDRFDGEAVDHYRERVGAAFADPDALDRAVPTNAPKPFVLGGFSLGDPGLSER